MEICCMIHRTQIGVLYNLEGWVQKGDGRDVQERGGVCIPMADSC